MNVSKEFKAIDKDKSNNLNILIDRYLDNSDNSQGSSLKTLKIEKIDSLLGSINKKNKIQRIVKGINIIKIKINRLFY